MKTRSKIHWKAGLALVGVLVAGVGGALLSTSTAQANPTQSIHRAYYSSASFNTMVGGRWILKCGGGGGSGWGSTTAYYVQSTAPCSGSSPPLVLCYVDGVLGGCP